MSGLIDSATAVMRASSQRVDNSAINVANISTPGFKRRLTSTEQTSFSSALQRVRVDLKAGKVTETGRSLDLAINGDGYFQLRAGDVLVYSRQGSFSLAADGRVVTPQGYVLQQSGGGDLTLDSGSVKVADDGTVLDDAGQPLGRIALFTPRTAEELSPIDGSIFESRGDAMEEMAAPSLRQGALETSNVSLGDEMVGMMGALRGAETGARLVQVYDDLMGKAIATFGQVSR